jgi:hypothetical protein
MRIQDISFQVDSTDKTVTLLGVDSADVVSQSGKPAIWIPYVEQDIQSRIGRKFSIAIPSLAQVVIYSGAGRGMQTNHVYHPELPRILSELIERPQDIVQYEPVIADQFRIFLPALYALFQFRR